jgi:transposase
MDTRQEKGLILAKNKGIRHVAGPTWVVPSQSNEQAAYLVNVDEGTCSCPDFELRRAKCKHFFAVEFSRTVETAPDGTQVVTETVKVVRKTYSQPWAAYNAAQTSEKSTVQSLLRDLCDGVATPAHAGRGPKPISFSDAIFGMAWKTYLGTSGRRASTDIDACTADGALSRDLAYNTIFKYAAKDELTPILVRLIEESARPLASVESSFAIDSTGFGTCVYRRWFDHKWGKERSEAKWLKAHATVGVVTGIVTAVSVTDSNCHDSPELPALVESTAQRFQTAEISADKAYLSNANLTAIEAVGAVPFVPFKSNSRGEGSPAWRRMWAMFVLRQDEFLASYHKRSNVESVFSAIKRTLGGSVRSKKFTAQVNEVLTKILAHNLIVLVHAMHELGIEPSFATAGA